MNFLIQDQEDSIYVAQCPSCQRQSSGFSAAALYVVFQLRSAQEGPEGHALDREVGAGDSRVLPHHVGARRPRDRRGGGDGRGGLPLQGGLQPLAHPQLQAQTCRHRSVLSMNNIYKTSF